MKVENSATTPDSVPLPRVPFWQVDSFTSVPWRGNPAGVCVLDTPAPGTWMQAVAAEVNVAETAFLHPGTAGEADWVLRWFTPVTEVDLCGHATLAAAHVLVSTGRADGEITFATRSGVLRAARRGEEIEMDLPNRPASEEPLPAPVSLALGSPEVLWSGRCEANWLIELRDATAVLALRPDAEALAAAAGPVGVIATAAGDAVGVVATAAAGAGADFVSRYFVPGLGIPEDPATGSAHCTLAPYWTARVGRDRLTGHQVSARGGWVGACVAGDRVKVSGAAVTVISGTVLAPGVGA